jgi:hypothetical protein
MLSTQDMQQGQHAGHAAGRMDYVDGQHVLDLLCVLAVAVVTVGAC